MFDSPQKRYNIIRKAITLITYRNRTTTNNNTTKLSKFL